MGNLNGETGREGCVDNAAYKNARQHAKNARQRCKNAREREAGLSFIIYQLSIKNKFINYQLKIRLSIYQLKIMEPRGLRNNNPLNIVRGKSKWQGLKERISDSRFCEFVTPEYGPGHAGGRGPVYGLNILYLRQLQFE